MKCVLPRNELSRVVRIRTLHLKIDYCFGWIGGIQCACFRISEISYLEQLTILGLTTLS
jgi:hypothetical protein